MGARATYVDVNRAYGLALHVTCPTALVARRTLNAASCRCGHEVVGVCCEVREGSASSAGISGY